MRIISKQFTVSRVKVRSRILQQANSILSSRVRSTRSTNTRDIASTSRPGCALCAPLFHRSSVVRCTVPMALTLPADMESILMHDVVVHSIRQYRHDDVDACRTCVVELQDAERQLDPRLRSGDSMADEYLRQMHERCRLHAGT